MPDFSVETWTSFKEQFYSVIQFLMYCFDLMFDSFRSNPLLYIGFFFPVFGLAFFAIFDLFINPTSVGSLTYSGKNVGVIKQFKSAKTNIKGRGVRSYNLAALSKPESKSLNYNKSQSISNKSFKSISHGSRISGFVNKLTSFVGSNIGLKKRDKKSFLNDESSSNLVVNRKDKKSTLSDSDEHDFFDKPSIKVNRNANLDIDADD